MAARNIGVNGRKNKINRDINEGWQRQREYEQRSQQEQEPPDSSADYDEGDPFKILGVSENATDAEVKDAWRRLSKEWHPDTFTDKGEEVKKMAAEHFDKVQKAYERITELRSKK